MKSVEPHAAKHPGELRFTVHRRDGGTDHILRRFPGQPPVEFQRAIIQGDLGVLRSAANGTERTRLEVTAGEDSVAKKSR